MASRQRYPKGLTVVPISGLANRMRVVVSAVVAARTLSVPVRLVWRPSWDCRARFDQLFLPLSGEQATVENGSWRDTPATKRNLCLPLLLRKRQYAEEWRCYDPGFHPDLMQLTTEHPSLYMDTCFSLGPYSTDDLRKTFRPLPTLQERIDSVAARFTGKTVGVHVRRADHVEAIRHSPLSAFRHRVDRLLDTGKADSVFLCTDDEHVRQYFREAYGERLLTRQPHLERHTLRGMEDAVVDLWSLARTTRILGSYHSSFSDTAAELGNIPFETVTESETPDKTPDTMKRQLVFATNNVHKLREIREIMPADIEVLSLADLHCEGDIPETAETLEGNALIKAHYVYDRFGLDCFADDTGLEVDALGGGPGVHTARYAGDDQNPQANMKKILAEMKEKTNRHARFRTVIALIEKGEEHLFEGRVDGIITTEARGEQGFGYDPVFSPEDTGQTFAEMGEQAKNRISHRARAVQKLLEYINKTI